MSKAKNLKKILFSLAIVGIALGVSACVGEMSETEKENKTSAGNVLNTDNQISMTSGVIGDKSSQPESKNSISNGKENKEEDEGDKEEDKTNNKTTNKINTNTIMNPDNQEDLTKVYSQAILKTSLGNITLKFYASETPITVNNFLNLAKAGFYNGTKFHRVMKDFMIQGGDPLTKEADASVYGTGGPGYQFKNEYGTHKLVAGNIAMANAGLNTNGSQFFIVTAEATPYLDGSYTNFGEVIGGMDVVRKIENSAVTMSARGEMSVPVDYVTISGVELVK